MEHLGNVFLVLFLAYISLAGGSALLHMIIQAGAVPAAVTGQSTVAGADHINPAHQLDHVFYCRRAGVGAEILCLVLFHGSGKKDSGVWLVYGHFDEGIGLVILQHGVIFRAVLFDQVALQNQGFQLGIGDNVLKPCNMGDHLLDLGALVAAALEILADTVLQADGFSNVDDLILFTMHNVDTRLTGQLL